MVNNLDLTVLITTYNRYPYLERLLNYFLAQPIKFKIIILDSSAENYPRSMYELLEANPQIERKSFYPTTTIPEKISEGLLDVDTKYAVICADDDFLVPSGLKSCIEFLESNPSYASAHGRYINHMIKDKFIWSSLYGKALSIRSETSFDRLMTMLTSSKVSYPFYAVHKTSDLLSIWKHTKVYSGSIPFNEIISSACSVMVGPSKILPVFYSSRESNTYNWITPENRFTLFTQKNIMTALDGIQTFLFQYHSVNDDEHEQIFVALDDFVNPPKKKNNFLYPLTRRIDDAIWVSKLEDKKQFNRELKIIKREVMFAKLSTNLLNKTRMEY